jgi:hypothetical protein
MQGKFNTKQVLAEVVAGPLNIDIDMTTMDRAAIQVVYGPGATMNLELHVSVNGTDFSIITAMSQAQNVLGDSHIWDLTNINVPILRVVLPSDTVGATVTLIGLRLDKKE